MIARALIHEPHVIFLDEPTVGLDPQARLALWDILRELHAEGRTIVMTTHYMEEADQLCDRVAIVDRGKLLALDTPAELKQRAPGGTLIDVTLDGDAARGRGRGARGRRRARAPKPQGPMLRVYQRARRRGDLAASFGGGGARPRRSRTSALAAEPRDAVRLADREEARLSASPIGSRREPGRT